MSLFEHYPLDCLAFEDDDFQDLSGCGDSYSSLSSKRKRDDEWFSEGSPESHVSHQTPTKQFKSNNNTSCSWTSSTIITPTMAEPIAPLNNSASNLPSQIISFYNSNSSPDVASSHHHQKSHSLDSSVVVKPKTESLDFSAPFSISQPQKTDSFWLQLERKTTPIARNTIQAQDHVIAERKRREKLSQRFIALSAMLPGLKKVLHSHFLSCYN